MEPISFLYAIAMLVASYAITALTTRSPPDSKPAALTDFDFPQIEEGTPQMVVFGDCWVEDWMVLWYGNYSVEALRGKSGKK